MDARTQGIGELIEHRRHFAVPDHQRDYAWGEEEVEQFFRDITRALTEDAPDYFVGLIVMVDPEPSIGDQWQILDGQQRLATTTMIYAGIREWLHAAGLERDATKIQGDHIGVMALGEQTDRPRLVLNINDRDTFQALVVDRANDATLISKRDGFGRYSSQRKVAQAALTCRERVQEFATERGRETGDQATALYALAHYLREKVKVVAMNVSSETNAYVIFESLNDRGLDLSVLDLVKNHLFGRAGPHLPVVKNNWAQIAAHLGDRSADDFLKVFWTSRYGRIQRGKLFHEWRNRFDALESHRVVELTADLIIAADRFAALDSDDDELWKDFPPAFREGLHDLALLGNRQMRPVLLAALDRLPRTDLAPLVRRLVVATMRYQTVGKGRTGGLEIACARVARGIAHGELSGSAAVWSQLSAIVPGDEDFLQDFKRYSEPKATIAKYALRRLEAIARQQETGTASELEPGDNLTLEHILPQNPSDAWASALAEDPDLREQTNRLGNLCLLRTKTNQDAANRSYSAKATELYGPSELRLTAEIPVRHAHWDRAEIRGRQERLASLAVATWRV